MKKSLALYYSEIGSLMICDRKQKKAFMKELQEDINEFLVSNPQADMKEIYSVFGSPEAIADSFAQCSEAAQIKKKIDIKKWVIVFLALVFIIYLAFIVISLIDVHSEAHGYYEEGIMMMSLIKGGGIL